MGDSNQPYPEDDDAGDGAPASSRFDGEDFLFHLYRGSELLQDNCIAEAKEELERALAMQPRDTEGQALLAVVYFRLGLYPRAIEIYEALLRAFPTEITPRLNLALCYLKTGQYGLVRELLEEVVRKAPDHRRAWGYLGLAFERGRDYAKAQVAFERAGQSAMAQRMERLVHAEHEDALQQDPARDHVRQAAADAVRELDLDPSPFSHAEAEPLPEPTSVGRWLAHEPGRNATVPTIASLMAAAPSLGPEALQLAVPAAPRLSVAGLTPTELAARLALPEPAQGVDLVGERLAVVRVEGSLVVRSSAIRALVPDETPFQSSPAYRRARGRQLDEPLGGVEAALGQLEGRGRVVLGPDRGEGQLLAMVVGPGELLYVREDFLVGFVGTVRHESGRLARGDSGQYPVVQLSGEGAVILGVEGQVHALAVTGSAPLTVADTRVIGWSGRLLPRPLEAPGAFAGGRGFVSFTGSGSVFVSLD